MTKVEAHVAFASDAAYLPWVATAALSCIQASPELFVHVHLLHAADVSAADRERLSAMVRGAGGSLELHQLDARALGDLPPGVAAHGGAISCARFLLPDLLPTLDRLLYLDADTLTVSSLAPLWAVDVSDHTVAAVRNVVEPSMRQRLLDLGVKDPLRYFNSGLLIMNLRRMRERGSSAALLAYIHQQGERLLWVDQDALNVVLADEWLELHPRWNTQNSFWDWPEWAREVLGAAEVSAAVAFPAVLHFEGPSLCKPWHFLCRHQYVSEYRRVLRSTPWASQPLLDKTLMTQLIFRLPRRQRVQAYLRLQRWRAKRQS